MAGVMIIGVCKDLQIPRHELPEYFNPIGEVPATVNDGLVSCLCQFLDSIAVSKPADIGKVGSNQIELARHLP